MQYVASPLWALRKMKAAGNPRTRIVKQEVSLSMDEETRKVLGNILDDLEKQRRLNSGILKCIDDLRNRQEKILEILSGE